MGRQKKCQRDRWTEREVNSGPDRGTDMWT